MRILSRLRQSRPRILALLTFRDEMRFLPGFFENVPRQVDGVLALDDGSVDGSAEFVAAQRSVVELLRRAAGPGEAWDDRGNHRRLVEAAWKHGHDWLLGVDADERLEDGFGRRARDLVREKPEESAFRIIVRELWDRPDTYRVDGVWGQKGSARLFRSRRDHLFDSRSLHGHWAPLNDYPAENFPNADLVLYHLRMIEAADRADRRQKYEYLDPNNEQQAIGYAYLTDATGIVLEKLPPGRGYVPLGR